MRNAFSPRARYSLAAQREQLKSLRQELSLRRSPRCERSQEWALFRKLSWQLPMLLIDALEKSGCGARLARDRALALLARGRASRCPADGKMQEAKSENSFNKKPMGGGSAHMWMRGSDQTTMQILSGLSRTSIIETISKPYLLKRAESALRPLLQGQTRLQAPPLKMLRRMRYRNSQALSSEKS